MTDSTAAQLNALLADYQVLYHKLRGYHWTVAGPNFFALHAKFEELYDDAALKIDGLAERIAALGGRPLYTMKDVLAVTRLSEDGGSPAANDMVVRLRDDYTTLNAALRAAAAAAGEAEDAATTNLLEGFADEQEQTVWMLNAYLAA